MEPKGRLFDGITETMYYDVRYNHELGYMSKYPLGLQALIYYMGDYVWINIKQQWLNTWENLANFKIPREG